VTVSIMAGNISAHINIFILSLRENQRPSAELGV
jgi:hypothetical protein